MTKVIYQKFLCSIALLLLGGCANIFNPQSKDQSITIRKDVYTGKQCLKNIKNISILGKYKKETLLFNEFRKNSKFNYSKIDLFSLLALSHMSFSPHKVTPYSKLQVMTNLGGEFKVYDFPLTDPSGTDATPYFLVGLNSLLHEYKSNNTLHKLAKSLDSLLASNIPINKELSVFLKKYKTEIPKFKSLNDAYFKVDVLLEEKETIKKLSYKNLISSYGKLELLIKPSHLFPYTNALLTESKWQSKCNIDLKLYEHEIFPITKNYDPIPFGLSFPDGTFIVGVTTQEIQSIMPVKGTHLFKGQSKSNKTVFCHLNKSTKDGIFLLSTKGKDPGQYIYQALKLKKISEKKDIEQLIESHRTLNLVNPHRILYESERGSTEILNNLLTKDKPVYHVGSLGNIWAYKSSGKNSTFITDSRMNSHLICR